MISIIVPIYNVENTIERCLKSVMSQTYNDSVECILVDDCGTDKSISIAARLLSVYAGPISFKMVHHKMNKGLGAARNTGVKKSIGDYVYFLDSDDEMTSDCLEILFSLAEKYAQPEIVVGRPKFMYDLDWIPNYPNLPEYVNTKENVEKYYFEYPVTMWNKLIKRSLFVDKNMWILEGVIHEDESWRLKCWHHINSIACSQKYTYIQYLSEGSICANPICDNKIISFVKIADDFMTTHSEQGNEKGYKLLMADIINNRKVSVLNIKNAKEINQIYRHFVFKHVFKHGILLGLVLLMFLLPKSIFSRKLAFLIYNVD